MIVKESGETSMAVIYSWWDLNVLMQVFILMSHTLTLVSAEPETNILGYKLRSVDIAVQLDRWPLNLANILFY